MILTVTINPALDKSSAVEKMLPDKKLRCAAPIIEAGGANGALSLSYPGNKKSIRFCR